VYVDASGTERVLDDSRTYTRETRADGTVAIFNNAGERVVVTDGSCAVFSDAEGREVSFDTANGVTTTTTNTTRAEGGTGGGQGPSTHLAAHANPTRLDKGARHLQALDKPHLMTFRFMRRGLTD
jgi:hypothetical protein